MTIFDFIDLAVHCSCLRERSGFGTLHKSRKYHGQEILSFFLLAISVQCSNIINAL
jgi:hypothetical protein